MWILEKYCKEITVFCPYQIYLKKFGIILHINAILLINAKGGAVMKRLQKRNNVEVKSVEAFVTRGSCSCNCTCITGNVNSILGDGGLNKALSKSA